MEIANCDDAAIGMFFRDSILSAQSKDSLWSMMVETSTGPGGIRGLLAADTVVVHKTGSSGTDDAGMAAATNDIGVVTLPKGKSKRRVKVAARTAKRKRS